MYIYFSLMTFLALPIILTLRPREAAPMFVSFKILEQIPFSLLTHFSVCSNSHLLMCIWGSSSHAYLENKGADVHLCWRSSLVNAIPRIHLAFLLSHSISWVFFQLFFSSGEGKKKKNTTMHLCLFPLLRCKDTNRNGKNAVCGEMVPEICFLL